MAGSPEAGRGEGEQVEAEAWPEGRQQKRFRIAGPLLASLVALQIAKEETDLAFSRHFMAICWKIVAQVI